LLTIFDNIVLNAPQLLVPYFLYIHCTQYIFCGVEKYDL